MMMAFSFSFFFCKRKFITYFLLWVRLFCVLGFTPQNNPDAIFSLQGAHQAFSLEGEGRANEIVYGCAV